MIKTIELIESEGNKYIIINDEYRLSIGITGSGIFIKSINDKKIPESIYVFANFMDQIKIFK